MAEKPQTEVVRPSVAVRWIGMDGWIGWMEDSGWLFGKYARRSFPFGLEDLPAVS